MLKFFSKNLWCILPLALVIGIVLAGSYLRVLDNYELDALDYRFKLRPSIPVSDKIVLIEIGDDTIASLGRFPFDRSYHAALVKALSKAKAVVFDIFFSEEQDSDSELQQAMHESGNVYLPFVFELDYMKKSGIPAAAGYSAKTIEGFAELAKGTGHINVIPDPDGKFRRVPLFIKYKDKFFPYLSFLVSLDFLGIPEGNVRLAAGKYVGCGSYTTIPLDKQSNIIVNYAGAWGRAYRHYSYLDVARSYIAHLTGEPGLIDLNVFKDKVCVIGLTAAGTTDLHPSPFEPLYPSVGIHADIINSILQKKFIRRVSPETNLLILAFLSLLSGFAFMRTKPLKGLYSLLGIIIIFTLICIGLFALWGLWIDLFYPTLSLAIIYMFCTLRKYVMEWKTRLLAENELQIAKRIQESFLPKELPKTGGIDIAACLYMAKQVGGDIYDFNEFSEDKLGVMVGDVSGKGVPASLFMSMVSGAYKFFAQSEASPADTLHNLNAKIIRDSNANLFVTMFYAVFDLKEMAMSYANGGHLPVLYMSKDAAPVFLDVKEGMPLGMVENFYSGEQISLASGDTFVFYTDGLTEARNRKSQMYGQERLASLVEKHRGFGASSLLSAIEKDVRSFEPKKRQHDDITLIVIKIA